MKAIRAFEIVGLTALTVFAANAHGQTDSRSALQTSSHELVSACEAFLAVPNMLEQGQVLDSKTVSDGNTCLTFFIGFAEGSNAAAVHWAGLLEAAQLPNNRLGNSKQSEQAAVLRRFFTQNMYCLKEGTTVDNLIWFYVNHMLGNSQDLNKRPAITVSAALAKSFPCPQSGEP